MFTFESVHWFLCSFSKQCVSFFFPYSLCHFGMCSHCDTVCLFLEVATCFELLNFYHNILWNASLSAFKIWDYCQNLEAAPQVKFVVKVIIEGLVIVEVASGEIISYMVYNSLQGFIKWMTQQKKGNIKVSEKSSCWDWRKARQCHISFKKKRKTKGY